MILRGESNLPVWLAGQVSGGTAGPSRSGGVLLHSDDGGRHWAVLGSKTLFPEQVYFATPADGWLIASGGKLLVTHDVGQNWQQLWPIVPSPTEAN